MATEEERIRRGLVLSKKLVALVDDYFPQAWSGTDYNNWQVASGGILLRAKRSLQAIIHLAEGPYVCDAATLMRSLYEHVVTFAWLAVDPAERLPRWIRADAQNRLQAHDELAKLGDGFLNSADEQHFRGLVAAGKGMPRLPVVSREADDHWSKVLDRVHSRADERYGFAGLYRAMYRVTSKYVHPTPLGVNNTLAVPQPGVVVLVGETVLMPEPFTLSPIIFTMGLLVAEEALCWPDRETLMRLFRENEIDSPG